MDVRTLLFENPLLVKHVRARLRRQHLAPLMAAVSILALCIVWAGIATDTLERGQTFGWLLALQAGILFLMGAAQVAGSIAYARESGTLDFHRISPQSALATTLGFVVGAPVREYLLFACTLPFSLLTVGQGHPSVGGWLAVMAVMLVAAFFYNSLAALGAVIAPKPRGTGGWIVALILLLNVTALTGVPVSGALTVIPTAQEAVSLGNSWLSGSSLEPFHFFGLLVPQLLIALVHLLPLAAFFFVAVARKMRHDRALLYSKPVAVVFLAVIAFLALGDAWKPTSFWDDAPLYAMVYLLTTAALLLTLAVTPGAGAYANGVRRAQQLGRTRAPLWSDLAANWAPLVAFAGLILAAGLLGTHPAQADGSEVSPIFLSAIVAATVVIAFGSAKQYFDLRFRKNSAPYFLFFLFCIWGVPLLAGLLASLSGVHGAPLEAILAVSPVTGIGLAGAASNWGLNSGAGLVTALASSTLLALGFLCRRVGAERAATERALRSEGRERAA
jgi:NADH:ubiquinone oxidoreductase subunit 6 (subunit J)